MVSSLMEMGICAVDEDHGTNDGRQTLCSSCPMTITIQGIQRIITSTMPYALDVFANCWG